jgi:AcrR family transcriptional regulator
VARPAKFSEDQILDATLQLVATGGPGAATMSAIAAAVGAPVGSLYHRFASRELLLARLWIRTVRRFQRGFIAALADNDLDAAAIGASLHAVTWARDHLDEARVLLLHRRQDLVARWPQELGDELAQLNDGVEAAVRDHARRRYGSDDEDHLQRLTFALADLPYAAMRRYLAAGEPPPASLEDLVATTCGCVLAAAPAH